MEPGHAAGCGSLPFAVPEIPRTQASPSVGSFHVFSTSTKRGLVAKVAKSRFCNDIITAPANPPVWPFSVSTPVRRRLSLSPSVGAPSFVSDAVLCCGWSSSLFLCLVLSAIASLSPPAAAAQSIQKLDKYTPLFRSFTSTRWLSERCLYSTPSSSRRAPPPSSTLAIAPGTSTGAPSCSSS